MQVLINVLIIAGIAALAIGIIVNNFHRSKKSGRCAACSYDCEIKRLARKKHA